MPNIQPTYSQTLPVAVPGMVADMETHTIISRVVSNSAGIAFGAVAVQGTTGDLTVQPVTGSAAYVGITVVDPTVRPVANNAYAQNDVAAVITKGVVWVTAGATVTVRQPVYFDASGNITNVSTSNTAIPGAVFDSGAASGALVKVRLG